jgi:hypothetical protein
LAAGFFFAAAFFAGFFAAAFFAAGFFAAAFFAAGFFAAAFFAGAFFAAAFFAGAFFAAAFFAVAISFLLDQVTENRLAPAGLPVRSSYSPLRTAQEGRPDTMNSGAKRVHRFFVPMLHDSPILILHT